MCVCVCVMNNTWIIDSVIKSMRSYAHTWMISLLFFHIISHAHRKLHCSCCCVHTNVRLFRLYTNTCLFVRLRYAYYIHNITIIIYSSTQHTLAITCYSYQFYCCWFDLLAWMQFFIECYLHTFYRQRDANECVA